MKFLFHKLLLSGVCKCRKWMKDRSTSQLNDLFQGSSISQKGGAGRPWGRPSTDLKPFLEQQHWDTGVQ